LTSLIFISSFDVHRSSRGSFKIFIKVRSKEVGFFLFGIKVRIVSLKGFLSRDRSSEIVNDFTSLGLMRVVMSEVIFIDSIFSLRSKMRVISLVKDISLRS